MASLLGFRCEFPTQRNRELFSRNREFCRKNREFHLPKPKSMPDEVFGTHPSGAPQSGFLLRLISPMSVRSSSETPRSANTVARSPAPIRSKPSAVPANDCLWPDNRYRAKDGREPAIKPNKQKKRSVLLRYGRFGARRRSTLICCRRIRISAASFALDLKSEVRTPRISLNRSFIRSQTYPVCSLRPC